MRWKQIVELAKVNILYANPQLLEKKRQKTIQEADTMQSAVRSVLWQNSFILVLFLGLYTMMLRGLDFTVYHGYFSLYITMFVVMTILQSFYIIYNLLYESKDLAHYLPLPFKTSEVFLAKLSVIVLNVIPYIAPVFSLFLLLGHDAQIGLLGNIVYSLILFTLLTTIVFLFAIVLVHLISRLSLFQKHKKIMTTVLYSVSSMGMIAAILFISNSSSTSVEMLPGQILPDVRVVPFFGMFHSMMVSPLSIEGITGMAVWLGLLLVFLFIVIKAVIPGLYRQSDGQRITSKKVKSSITQKQVKTPTVKRTLLKYNISLILDGTLMMQYISSNIIFPVIWLGPMLSGNNFFQVLEPSKWWGLAIIIGLFYSYLTMSPMSTVGVIISLERENFLYIKSLPFSMKEYLRVKFWFAYVFQLLLPFAVSFVLILFTKVHWLLAISFFVGLTIGILGLSEHYFARDYRLLNLDWQNLTELFSRGGGNFIYAIRIFAALIVGVLVVVGAGFLLNALNPLGQQILSVSLLIVPIAVIFLLHQRHKEKFWSKL